MDNNNNRQIATARRLALISVYSQSNYMIDVVVVTYSLPWRIVKGYMQYALNMKQSQMYIWEIHLQQILIKQYHTLCFSINSPLLRPFIIIADKLIRIMYESVLAMFRYHWNQAEIYGILIYWLILMLCQL